MKKLLTLGLTVLAVTLLAGCSNSQPTEEEAVAPATEEIAAPATPEVAAPAVEATTGTETPAAEVAAPAAEVATGN